jgi:hypothetical protein
LGQARIGLCAKGFRFHGIVGRDLFHERTILLTQGADLFSGQPLSANESRYDDENRDYEFAETVFCFCVHFDLVPRSYLNGTFARELQYAPGRVADGMDRGSIGWIVSLLCLGCARSCDTTPRSASISESRRDGTRRNRMNASTAVTPRTNMIKNSSAIAFPPAWCSNVKLMELLD